MKLDLAKITFEDFDVLRHDGRISEEEFIKAKELSGSDFQYNFWELTLKDLDIILNGKIPKKIEKLVSVRNISAFEFFRRMNAFEQFMSAFCDIFEKWTIKESQEEKKAAIGLPKFTPYEGMLVFAREYFNISGKKAFDEAAEIALGDLYLARKDMFIRKSFERNLSREISRKTKK